MKRKKWLKRWILKRRIHKLNKKEKFLKSCLWVTQQKLDKASKAYTEILIGEK